MSHRWSRVDFGATVSRMQSPTIAVLDKATRLIDALAVRGGASATLSELVAATGLPPGTAGRVLRDLVRLGWADQPGLRGGYRLGPRAGALGLAQGHRARFFADAGEFLPALAERIAAPVSVACLRGLRRCVLHEWFPGAGVRHPALEERDDLWVTAGGRMLTAMLPAAERRRIISCAGLPGRADWPGVSTREDLADELAWIRRRNLAVQRLPQRPHASAAVAIDDGEGGRLAIGFHIPRALWNEARVTELQRTVAALKERLSR